MGNERSGGHNKLSDEEKKRRGTFKPSRSEAIYAERAAAKVVSGPWLDAIPEPELPLDDVAMKKYREITQMLFDQRKLTNVTRMIVESIAVCHGQIVRRMSMGLEPTGSLMLQFQQGLRTLKIADEADVVAQPANRTNKFKTCGFSNRRKPAR